MTEINNRIEEVKKIKELYWQVKAVLRGLQIHQQNDPHITWKTEIDTILEQMESLEQLNRRNLRLTDGEMEIDWTDDEGNPTDKVTLTESELYALLDAQLCQLIPQPLDDKDLREQLQDTYGVLRYGADAYERYKSGRNIPDDWNLFQYELDQILALLQPKIAEAKREERERIIDYLWEHYGGVGANASRKTAYRIAKDLAIGLTLEDCSGKP